MKKIISKSIFFILIMLLLIIFINNIKNIFINLKINSTYNNIAQYYTSLQEKILNVTYDSNSNTILENSVNLGNGICFSIVNYEKIYEEEYNTNILRITYKLEKENNNINHAFCTNTIIYNENEILFGVTDELLEALKYNENDLSNKKISSLKFGFSTAKAISDEQISTQEILEYRTKDDISSKFIDNLTLILYDIKYQENENPEYIKIENTKVKVNFNII